MCVCEGERAGEIENVLYVHNKTQFCGKPGNDLSFLSHCLLYLCIRPVSCWFRLYCCCNTFWNNWNHLVKWYGPVMRSRAAWNHVTQSDSSIQTTRSIYVYIYIYICVYLICKHNIYIYTHTHTQKQWYGKDFCPLPEFFSLVFCTFVSLEWFRSSNSF